MTQTASESIAPVTGPVTTRRAFFMQPSRFEVHSLTLDLPAPGQVMVRIAACGLCNSELGLWHGHWGVPPQSAGHEWSGTVVAVGEGVTTLALGDRITVLPEWAPGTGFSDYAVIPAKHCFRVAPHIPLEDALGEPVKCVVTVLRTMRPEVGDVAVVLGCGPMGLWCIQGLRGMPLQAVIAIDVSPEKLALAQQMGATHCINPREESAEARVREISEGRMADFVIEGTGVPAVMQDAITLARGKGRIGVMSYPEVAGSIDWRPVCLKGLSILAAHPATSPDEFDDMRRAVTLMNQGVFHMDGVISHRFSLDQIQEAFETLERKPADFVKGIVVPGDV